MGTPEPRLVDAIIEVIPGSVVDIDFRPLLFDGTLITVTNEAADWHSDYQLSRQEASQFDEYSEDFLFAHIVAHFLHEFTQFRANQYAS